MNAETTGSSPSHAAEKLAAHALWTELHTRVATRPLPHRHGEESGALDSLHRLSQDLRQLMARNPDAPRFQALALTVMQALTDHLSAWHPHRDSAGQIRMQKDRLRYRSALIQLQQRLADLAQQLHVLAHGEPGPSHQRANQDEETPSFGPAALSIVPTAKYENACVSDVEALSDEFQQLGIVDQTAICGLALSGGGIRSATFSLGILQGLQAQGLLNGFHYLSTVSGGGYLGGYLSGGMARLAKDPSLRETNASTEESVVPAKVATESNSQFNATDAVFQGLNLPERDWVRWLRNNSKYLLNVPFRIPRIAALLFYGLLENTLTLVGLAMLAGLLISLLIDLQGLSSFALILLALVAGYVGLRPLLPPRLRQRWYLDYGAVALATLAVLMAAVGGVDALAQRIHQWLEEGLGLGIVGSLFAMTVAASHTFPALSKFLRPKLLSTIALIIGPMIFLAIAVLTHALAAGHWQPGWLNHLVPPDLSWVVDAVLAGITAVILLRALLVDANQGGLRSYYRGRLRSCYGVTPNPKSEDDEVQLTDLPSKPCHIVNMALNAPASTQPELRGRGCDFFAATKFYCGSRLTGYQKTHALIDKDPRFDLATAIATSGAAASSLMGRQSSAQFQFLMTLFNIRLGYWLRWATTRRWLPPNAYHLVLEALGHVHETGHFINLSDGGHIENLAVYELLRRRVQFIVCIDGGCDPSMSCSDLIRLDRYARIDLNVKLNYALDDLTPNAAGHCPSYGTLVRIDYPGNLTGWMLYFKLAMTGGESQVIQDYRKASPTFPHETTADQFFNEEQFEAYRLLGETAARHFFDSAYGTLPERLQQSPAPLVAMLNALSRSIGQTDSAIASAP